MRCAAKPLAVRMRGDECVELGRRAAPCARRRGLRRSAPRAPRAGLSSRRAASACANGSYATSASAGAAPERERLARGVAVLDQPRRTARRPARPASTRSEIAGRPRDDAVGAERLPERVHVHLERARAARRRLLAPDAVDQAVDRDDLVRVEQEQREQRPRPLPAESDRPTVVAHHLQRPQQPELHSPFRTSLKPTLGGS